MPPKSKRCKNSETSKENVCVSIKSKSKNVCKGAKAPRKALGDKTNSASDDNELVLFPKQVVHCQKNCEIKSIPNKLEVVDEVPIRRSRRHPERFLENQVLTNCNGNQDKSKMCNSANNAVDKKNGNKNAVKTADITEETSLADSRPKRICRLPSKFEDHSISPSKFVPVKPIQASTPIVQNKGLKVSSKLNIVKDKNGVKRNLRKVQTKTGNQEKFKENKSEENSNKNKDVFNEKPNTTKVQSTKLRKGGMQNTQKGDKEIFVAANKQADTNNNAKDSIKVDKKCIKSNRFLEKDHSFKVFDGKKANKRHSSKLDVYEFTYDPNEEPPPQKKKRKRVVRKKQEKAKPTFANNYDKNVAKSLAALKKVLSSKSSQSKTHQSETTIKQQTNQNKVTNNVSLNTKRNNVSSQLNCANEIAPEKNFNSFHVEDIVLNHESANHLNDINYSPINSPNHVRLPSEPRLDNIDNVKGIATNKDPLNLQDNISFFDESPAASSSMNLSTRNPSATPWRVEFGQLPIKWQVNTYVKPNMTPAVESSFINFGDEKKKHVYTNMVTEENEGLPEILESDNTSRLKQASIISYIKEVVEKSERIKSKKKSTPVKANSIYEDISNNSIYTMVTPIKNNASGPVNNSTTPKKKKSTENVTSRSDSASISEKENSIEALQNVERNKQKKNNDITFFGFDEIEEQDQENISPTKKIDKCSIQALQPRSRAILQELNAQAGPTRVHTAIVGKTKVNDNADSMFDQMKSATDAQVFSEKIIDNNSERKNDANKANSAYLSQEDYQSVHLFEDLDVIHHTKPPRKSYGKAKKVAFRQNSVSSDTQEVDVVPVHNGSSEEDYLDDLTFQVPSMQLKKSQRKKKAKNKLSKKEAKEADAWAAGFNSMCEDIDDFDLVVE